MLRRGMMAATSGVVTFAAAIASDNPYLWWRLGESSGTAAADASGNGRPGAYGGTAGVAYDLGEPGLVGDSNTAVEIKTDGGFVISSSQHPIADSGVGTTIMIAVKVNNGASAGALLTKHAEASPSTAGGNRDPWFYVGTDGRLRCGFWSGTTSLVTSTDPINDGVRRLLHLRIGVDGSEGAQMYIDGSLEGSVSAVPSLTYNGFITGGYNNIGFWPDAANAAALGIIDEVAVFNSRLSEARIAAHAAAAGL